MGEGRGGEGGQLLTSPALHHTQEKTKTKTPLTSGSTKVSLRSADAQVILVRDSALK